ncbi:MAG: hypothetical protein AAF827_18335, partial [Cyanobacteria bacterium P01_D01_bin.6]
MNFGRRSPRDSHQYNDDGFRAHVLTPLTKTFLITVADALPPPAATPRSPQPTSALIWLSGALFGPAVMGLGWQVFAQQALSHRLLALGLLLTGIEQGRMAMVDLRQ